MTARVLISGGSGLIGAHVVREISSHGYRVRVIARGMTSAKSLEGLDVELVQGDVGNREALIRALEGCESFIHCASPYPMHAIPRRANVEAARLHMQQVISAVQTARTARFVYTSTIGTVGSSRKPGGPFTEDDYLPEDVPATYHRMKVVMERMVLEEARVGRLPAVVVNPSMVLGPYDSKPRRFHLLANSGSGKVPIYMAGNINAVSGAKTGLGHRLALERGRVGARYLLGGENTTFKEVLGRIARLAGVRPPLFAVPLGLAYAVAYTTEVLGLIFQRSDYPLFSATSVDEVRYAGHYDTSLAEKELGFPPGDDLDTAIRQGLEWCRVLGYLPSERT